MHICKFELFSTEYGIKLGNYLGFGFTTRLFAYISLKGKPFNLTRTYALTWHISFLGVHTRKELSLQLSVIFVFVEPPATGEHHLLTQGGCIDYHFVQEPTSETTLVVMTDPTTRI